MAVTTRPDRAGNATDAGGPPSVHPLWQRLNSPLSTYYLLLTVTGTLLVIGLVMVLSASSVKSLAQDGSGYTIFVKQVLFAGVGLLAAAVASRLPVSFYRRMSVPLLVGAIGLELLVFTPLGTNVNGNRNWLDLGPIQVQPSEFGKIALVLFGASVLSAKRRRLGQWRHAIVPLVVPAGVTLTLLVLLGRDLGTSLVLLAIVMGLLWAAGVSGRLFLLAGGVCAVLVGGLVLVSSNRMGRLSSWLSCDDINACWQTSHSQAALADGGLIGVGLGASRQKWSWLPEAHNDFIFAVLGEELGIAGTLAILVLFALFALACYRVVQHTRDPFVHIATGGVAVWVLGQASINIGAVIGLLPVVGVPLPLVSYGGSALVSTLLAVGILVSFARAEPGCRRALSARPRLLHRSWSVLASRPGQRATSAPSRARARG